MKTAWDSFGHYIGDADNGMDAICYSELDRWEIRKSPLITLWDEIDVPGSFALTTQRRTVLSVVGSRHKIIQNEELVPLIDAIHAIPGARFHRAGQIDSKVFVTVELANGHIVAVVNGHDTVTPLSIMVTPVEGSALLQTFTLKVRVDAFQGEIEETIVGWEARFAEVRGHLLATPLTENIFRAYAVRLLTPGRNPATVTRNTNKLDEMSAIYGSGSTARDGFVALCQWYDTKSPVRGPDTVRARKAIFEPGFKDRALELMLSI